MRYARPDPVTGIRPHALWHKHVHNVDLDPMQVLKMQEMDAQSVASKYRLKKAVIAAVSLALFAVAAVFAVVKLGFSMQTRQGRR